MTRKINTTTLSRDDVRNLLGAYYETCFPTDAHAKLEKALEYLKTRNYEALRICAKAAYDWILGLPQEVRSPIDDLYLNLLIHIKKLWGNEAHGDLDNILEINKQRIQNAG